MASSIFSKIFFINSVFLLVNECFLFLLCLLPFFFFNDELIDNVHPFTCVVLSKVCVRDGLIFHLIMNILIIFYARDRDRDTNEPIILYARDKDIIESGFPFFLFPFSGKKRHFLELAKFCHQ